MRKICFSVLIIILGILSIVFDGDLTEIPMITIIAFGIFTITYGLLNIYISIKILRKNKVINKEKYSDTNNKNSLEYYSIFCEMILFSGFFCILIIIISYLIVIGESRLFWSIFLCICILICSIRACKKYIDYKRVIKNVGKNG